MALLWANVCPCLCHTGEPGCGPSTPVVASSVLRGRIISLDQIAMVFISQPRKLFATFGTEARYWLTVSSHCLFCQGAFHQVSLQLVLVHGVISPYMQRLSFSFYRLHAISVSTLLHTVKVPLNCHLVYQPLLPALHHLQILLLD